jgi:hypothetical protein
VRRKFDDHKSIFPVGSLLTFAAFTSVSLDDKVADGFGDRVLFNFTRVRGVRIRSLSAEPQEAEVLVPPSVGVPHRCSRHVSRKPGGHVGASGLTAHLPRAAPAYRRQFSPFSSSFSAPHPIRLFYSICSSPRPLLLRPEWCSQSVPALFSPTYFFFHASVHKCFLRLPPPRASQAETTFGQRG